MPFCPNCGNQHSENAGFCQYCGQPVASVFKQPYTVPPQSAQATQFQAPPPPAQFMNEPVLVIVPDLQKNNATGARDSYYLVVTPSRSIFVKITPLITQNALQQRQAKTQDQVFFKRWKEQVAGPDYYIGYLQALTPAGMLAESPESYFIDNMQIQQVSIKYYYREDFPSEWHLGFQTTGGLMTFVTTSGPEKLLASAYPGRVVNQK